MRRQLIVLALAASAAATAGAGLTARWIMSDEPDRKTGVQAGATGPVGKDGTAAVARRPLDTARLRQTVRAYNAQRPGKAGVMAVDLRTGRSFGENEKGRFVSASIMKVDILTGLLLRRQNDRRGLSESEKDLARQMIRESDNSAADALYAESGYGSGIREANRRLGLTETTPFQTSWGSSLTSPADQVRLLTSLAGNGPLGPPGREYVLGLMGTVLREQAWGVSAAARPGERVALKNGWTPVREQGHGWTINSIGRITGPDHDFLVAVCSGENPTMEDGVTTVEHMADLVVSTMRQ
ncbi:serine hydrolase [Actinomadura graeca]|uniref:Serine hydrolase n=1 Tax=Actinomadura graeca TaxID=2750812 RepID=A0ABX8QU46_9ACTN|nr:serine hydrolase [Actinomadura graeca]QXJ22158.1 serine hydrolase [Actinomadura graeca]